MTGKVRFSLKALRELVNTSGSCVYCQEACTKSLALLPMHLKDFKRSVRELLASLVTTYDAELGGIILAHKFVRIVDSIPLDDDPVLHANYTADIYYFKPELGSILNGTVYKKSKDFVGVLVHSIFNVAVPNSRSKTEDLTWDGHHVSVGSQVVCRVAKLNFTGRLPYIRATLESVEETGKRKKEKKAKHSDKTNEAPLGFKKIFLKAPETSEEVTGPAQDDFKEERDSSPKKKRKVKRSSDEISVDLSILPHDSSHCDETEEDNKGSVKSSPKKKKAKKKDREEASKKPSTHNGSLDSYLVKLPPKPASTFSFAMPEAASPKPSSSLKLKRERSSTASSSDETHGSSLKKKKKIKLEVPSDNLDTSSLVQQALLSLKNEGSSGETSSASSPKRKKTSHPKTDPDADVHILLNRAMESIGVKSSEDERHSESENKKKKKKNKKSREGLGKKGSTNRKRKRLVEERANEISEACDKRIKQEASPLNENSEPNIQIKREAKVKCSSLDPSVSSKNSETKITSQGLEVSVEQPTLLEGGVLRDYQLEGFKWLKLLFENGMNGILADEMGLGKTLQTIAILCHLYETGIGGPVLIIAPLSTLPNWILEFAQFAPKLPVIMYHGTESHRISLRKEIIKKYTVGSFELQPIVVTSFQIPLFDSAFLKTHEWKYIIVDEGHRLKNHQCQLARALSSYKSTNRILLTGTPLQNNLSELWSLLNFLMPEIFDSLEAFEAWFTVEDIQSKDCEVKFIEQEKNERILSSLHEILSPFLLRRVKNDVKLDLPRKKEVVVYCPLTRVQLDLYKTVLDKSINYTPVKFFSSEISASNIIAEKTTSDTSRTKRKARFVSDVGTDETSWEGVIWIKGRQYRRIINMNRPHVMLKRIVNHPYLVQCPVMPGTDLVHIDENIVTDCGKFLILDGLLKRLKERGHKVLIFSTYKIILDFIEDLATFRGYQYRLLTGDTDLEERKNSIKEFNSNPDIFLFLLSTRAGGLGINLAAADTVIIYDSDWNPQVDLQAQDRCHRIGQVRPVIVYRFIVPGTLDERIMLRASAKRKLEKLVIQNGRFNRGVPGSETISFDLEDLRKLLNEKQHELEIEATSAVLSEKQWNALLDRSDLLVKTE